MCRVYKRKNGKWYVRLCYYLSTSGKHVPVSEGYKLAGKHYISKREAKL